ncbi:uncharacterized protein LOC116129764 isoform X2 [Pistacia vera]|uniref:uncharacterized protein LOC116129764 isoform X2 n=1 Tax=Pistacia vera TaxID=55513 RepID=UPI001262AEB1|nr:uncharacterized protein LOC116129764 isoform X2 [Pistacia vera]
MENPLFGFGTRKRVRALPRAPDGSAFQKCQSCEVLVPIALAGMHECKTKKKVKRFRGVCEKPTVLKQGPGDHQVPITLSDTDEGETKKEVKSFRDVCEKPTVLKQGSGDHQVPITLADADECETKKEVKRFTGVCEQPTVLKQGSVDHEVRSPFRFFMESFVKMCKEEKLIDIDRKGFEAWKNMSMEEKLPYLDQAEKVDAAHSRAMAEEVTNMLVVADEAESARVGCLIRSTRAKPTRTLMAYYLKA